MPKYFGHKGHNKQTWQFKKTHPQLRVFQKETQARIGFFDQIKQLVQKQRSLAISETPGGTLTTEPSTSNSTDSQRTSQDTSSKTNFWSPLSQGCDGPISVKPTVSPTNRGTGDDSQGVHQSRQIGQDTAGTQSCCDRGISDQAARPADQGNCSVLRTPQAEVTYKHQTTQIYLKTRETATYSPWVNDSEEAEQVIYNFVQTIVQETQRHMQRQIEQCVQQTCSGLSIGHTSTCQRTH